MTIFSRGKAQKSGEYEIHDMIEKTFDKGDIIIREGENDTGAYKIIEDEDEVEVSIRSESSDIKLAALGKGAIFGEMSLIDQKPHSATVTVLTEVECTLVDKD